MAIPDTDRQRIRDRIAEMVYEALGADEVNIAATDGFDEADFNETAGEENRIPIIRTRAGENEHRLEIFWRTK